MRHNGVQQDQDWLPYCACRSVLLYLDHHRIAIRLQQSNNADCKLSPRPLHVQNRATKQDPLRIQMLPSSSSIAATVFPATSIGTASSPYAPSDTEAYVTHSPFKNPFKNPQNSNTRPAPCAFAAPLPQAPQGGYAARPVRIATKIASSSRIREANVPRPGTARLPPDASATGVGLGETSAAIPNAQDPAVLHETSGCWSVRRFSGCGT